MSLTKVTKDPADFENEDSEFEKRLEVFDKKANTNKFWRIWVYGRYVVRHWGRHGTKGQWAVHQALSPFQAREHAWDLYDKKYNKGYRKEAELLDRIAREIS